MYITLEKQFLAIIIRPATSRMIFFVEKDEKRKRKVMNIYLGTLFTRQVLIHARIFFI